MPRTHVRSWTTQGDPWQKVSDGVNDILNHRRSSLSLAVLHAAVGSLVSSSEDDGLTSGLQRIFTGKFKAWAAELSQRVGTMLLAHFSSISAGSRFCRRRILLADRRRSRFPLVKMTIERSRG
jgi:hypothetical protein